MHLQLGEGAKRMNTVMPESMIERSDKELLQRVSGRKDREAFEVFVTRHQQAAYGLALQLTGRHNLAEDAFQETCVRVWRFASSWREEASARSWLLRIVARESLRLRRHQHGEVNMPEEALNSVPAEGTVPEDQVDGSDLIVALRANMGRIPSRQRQIVALYYGAGLDQRQIGVHLKLSQQVVSYNIRDAIKRLRELLVSSGFATTVAVLENEALEKAICSGSKPSVEMLPRVLKNVWARPEEVAEVSGGLWVNLNGRVWAFVAVVMVVGITGSFYALQGHDAGQQEGVKNVTPVASDQVPDVMANPIDLVWDFKKNNFTGITKVRGEMKWISPQSGNRGGAQMHRNECGLAMLPVVPGRYSYCVTMDWRNTKSGTDVGVGCGWTDGQSTLPMRNYLKAAIENFRLNHPYRTTWVFVDGFMLMMDNGKLSQLGEFKLADRDLRMLVNGRFVTLDRMEIRSLRDDEANVWRRRLKESLKLSPSPGPWFHSVPIQDFMRTIQIK